MMKKVKGKERKEGKLHHQHTHYPVFGWREGNEKEGRGEEEGSNHHHHSHNRRFA